MSPWKYFIGPGLFREQSTLYRTLDDALLAMEKYDKLGLVPSGHAPWRPFIGRPASETSPFRPALAFHSWQVLEIYRFLDGVIEPTLNYLAAFSHPEDAFAFAEMKAKAEAAAWSVQSHNRTTFHVCLWGWTEDGRHPELARLPHDHLRNLRRQTGRAQARSYRLAAKHRLCAA